jgi:metal-responsive CopG/Arc/MetJ family transcriptional regulator
LAKTKISITVDEDLIKWLDSQIKAKKFASRSHGFEFALTQLKEKHN